MFNFFKKPQSDPNQKTVIFKLSGLHCTSCAVNIDLALEELPGVTSDTNYSKSITTVSYNPQQTKLKTLTQTIQDLGYQVTLP